MDNTKNFDWLNNITVFILGNFDPDLDDIGVENHYPCQQ